MPNPEGVTATADYYTVIPEVGCTGMSGAGEWPKYHSNLMSLYQMISSFRSIRETL